MQNQKIKTEKDLKKLLRKYFTEQQIKELNRLYS